MSKLIFRGVEISYFDFRQEEADCFVRMHCKADLSKPVMEAMKWGSLVAEVGSDEKPTGRQIREIEGIPAGKLTGVLAATNVLFTPNGDFKKHEMDIEVKEIRDFKFNSTSEGEKVERHLTFVILTSAKDAEGIVGHYMRKVLRQPAQMKITYERQMELGEDGEVEDETEGGEGGEGWTEPESSGTLASAREMGAGKRKRLADRTEEKVQ